MKRQTLKFFNHQTQKNEQITATYFARYIRCSEPSCQICSAGKGHGPYWHATFFWGSQVKKIVLGKKLDSNKVIMEIRRLLKQPVDVTQSFSLHSKPLPAHEKNNSRISTPNAGFPKPSCPPSFEEFQKDMIEMKKTARQGHLKILYRKLIKKYHPDRFPNHRELHDWMAEINALYHDRPQAGQITA